jgi:Fe-S-cluster containining protein
MIRGLSQPYTATGGVPTVDRVDTAIFEQRYFTHCLQCHFCGDSCCSYGADIDLPNVERLLDQADALESYVGVARESWFGEDAFTDSEYPGGAFRRTMVKNDACVFLNRRGRGCLIHTFALSRGMDYHDVKPMICSLFPVTYDNGLLHPSDEVNDRTLACLGSGPTVYRGARHEIDHYFGAGLVSELDAIERDVLGS